MLLHFASRNRSGRARFDLYTLSGSYRRWRIAMQESRCWRTANTRALLLCNSGIRRSSKFVELVWTNNVYLSIYLFACLWSLFVVLGGVVVACLPLDSKFAVWNRPRTMDFKGVKIHRTTSFGGEVKPEVQCWKVVRHVKEPLEVWKRYKVRYNSSFPFPFPFDLLLGDSAIRITRDLWWTNQEFYPFDIIALWFSMLIYHLGDEQ
jgi:hypothetical protein